MSEKALKEVRRVGRFFGPHFVFLKFAVILLVFYLVAHVCGLRGKTTILSGTVPAGEGQMMEIVLGLVYVLLYFATVVFVPVFILAAGLYWGATRGAAKLMRKQKEETPS
ncbi:MAG: hypothetical protein PWP23_279 [Candidatus Sumerlaeota bacterium]|nr:hypothetical protein [Candidatus Sumerlaeota bacterium]